VTATAGVAHAGVQQALEAWFAARLGDSGARVEELKRHAEGWSWQTYTLAVEANGERRGYAVRVEPEDGLLAPYDIDGQFRLHEVVRRHSDVPMPDIYWLEHDRSVLGMPFYVMERVEGAVPVQWRGDDPEIFPTPEVRREIGLQFVDIQARIHGLDWQAHGLTFPATPSSPENAPASQLDRWEGVIRESMLVDLPLLNHAIAWCRANLACSGALGLCHGDYRIGNFMVRDSAIVAIFDWELAHVSDPVEDIAYSGLPLFRGRNPLLSQLLARDEYFARYEELTGLRVEPDVFRFWTVFGLVKTAAAHLRATKAYEDGRVGDLRLAAMGHQVHYILRHLARELGVS
jgi:aminoglycoside phosphotransferase (APT) family kinase protein